MDYWICAGDNPSEIEEAYARATGKVPMMPEYGLGFWQCKLRYSNQEQLLEVAREYKRRNLPIDVIVCDFFHWPKMGDFRFEEEFFPDVEAMTAELKTMGIELMVSVWPQISLGSENFQEMKEHGYLVKTEQGAHVTMQWPEDSVFYDATNPKAREYVWDKCKKNYYDKGIKVFTFCPVMRLHGDRIPQTPVYRKNGTTSLFTGGNNEVWSFGEEAYEILVKYMQLREKLRPYIRTIMKEAHEKGSPIMRTMFYEFPEEEICWELKDQYMFGPDLLVAPIIWENATSRKVYFPSGAFWVDFHNGTRYKGGELREVEAPLDIIPVFIRDGKLDIL